MRILLIIHLLFYISCGSGGSGNTPAPASTDNIQAKTCDSSIHLANANKLAKELDAQVNLEKTNKTLDEIETQISLLKKCLAAN